MTKFLIIVYLVAPEIFFYEEFLVREDQ